MAIKIFNVCGRPLDSDTKEGKVKIFPGKPLKLESYMDIGQLMKTQIDSKLLKVHKVDPSPIPGPKSIDPEEIKKEAGKKEKLREKSAREKSKVAVTEDHPPLADQPETAQREDVASEPDDENNPYDGLKGDALVIKIMEEMIEGGDNLGRDGKPNQPVLEALVQEINPRMSVSAERRDKLFQRIKDKE